MAKKPKPQENMTTETPILEAPKSDIPVSPFFSKMLDTSEKHFGKKGLHVSKQQRIVGIEPYSLAFQWMTDLQVLPMQSIVCVSGMPKSYKTSTLLEFCSWFMLPFQHVIPDYKYEPGVGAIVHTEGKWSPSKVTSMLKELSDRLVVMPANSVEDWQEKASTYLNFMRDTILKKREAIEKKAKNSEYKDMRIPPMLLGIDSLTGSQSENIQETVKSEGHGSKTYQDRAMINWQWLGTWGSNLVGMPVTVVISNHLKDAINTNGGPPQQITGGGSGPGFGCALEIRVKNIGEIKKTYYEGAKLQWRCHFNSYGRDKRKIDIPYLESYDANDNQVAKYDWDTALVDLIVGELFESSMYKERVKSITGDITEYNKGGFGAVYACEALGIDKERALEEEISSEKLGQMLQKPGSEIRTSLQKALRIQPCEIWTPETVL